MHPVFVKLGRRASGLALALLAACNPTFNWREARLDETPLVALLPCKPDRGTRTVPLGGEQVEMRMMGCETGGVSFTVAVVPLADAARAAAMLAPWRSATLANFAAAQPTQQPFRPKGGQPVPDAQRLSANGKQAEGRAVVVQAAWFVRGNQAFQALAYGEALSAEVADSFFAGIALQ